MAQTRPEFEVASVKLAAAPDLGKGFSVSMSGGPGTDSPELFRCMNMSLRGLVATAHGTTAVQVQAPGWMEAQNIDISAKVPPGATRDQFRVMLQNLLVDRFKLELHQESVERPTFELVVAPGGSKLKKPAEIPTAGMPQFPSGRVSRYRPGEAMSSLVAYLTVYTGKLVTDRTSLPGEYEISLSWMRDDPTGHLNDAAGPSLETALEEQLGLKLKAKRGLVNFIVVDRAEKVPAEN